MFPLMYCEPPPSPCNLCVFCVSRASGRSGSTTHHTPCRSVQRRFIIDVYSGWTRLIKAHLSPATRAPLKFCTPCVRAGCLARGPLQPAATTSRPPLGSTRLQCFHLLLHPPSSCLIPPPSLPPSSSSLPRVGSVCLKSGFGQTDQRCGNSITVPDHMPPRGSVDLPPLSCVCTGSVSL